MTQKVGDDLFLVFNSSWGWRFCETEAPSQNFWIRHCKYEANFDTRNYTPGSGSGLCTLFSQQLHLTGDSH